jgi:DNA-binding NtrC family response regulator
MQTTSSGFPSHVGIPQKQPSFVVSSRAMTELLARAERAAVSPAKVLITGESGVGKNLVAQYIHSHSSRWLAPFVGVNCAGLTDARLESELFGRVKGNVTGACPETRGKLQLADRGTLFLDEVGDMSLLMQTRLLRFLENAEIQDVRPDRPHPPVDVRIVAATNRNLNDLVSAGQFREDFLQRLRAIHLHVPPLRERAEDVHVLLRHFLARSGRDLSFTDAALRALLRCSWPGNVRELLNVVEQLVWLSAGPVVGVQQLPPSMRSGPGRMMPADDNRQVADELYDTLVRQGASFWDHVYPMFLAHDITRDDLRELVRRGLRESRGRYKALLTLFGMSSCDYRHFMNFLAAHECRIGLDEFRALRTSDAEAGRSALSTGTEDWEQELAPRSKSRPH